MNTIDLKAEVEKAVLQAWPDFAAGHPHLAVAMDQTLLVDAAMDEIASDPTYQEALTQAAAQGALLEALGQIVKRMILPWIGGIMK